MTGVFSGAETDVLLALYDRGPLDDGDIPSKAGRDSLIDRGIVDRDTKGINRLTPFGMLCAVSVSNAIAKQRRE